MVCVLLFSGFYKNLPEGSEILAGNLLTDLTRLSQEQLMDIEVTSVSKKLEKVVQISADPFVIAAAESAYAASVEYEVKAAFVHNFARFIDWSRDSFETDESPIRIGILGQGPIDESLINLNGKEVQKRFLEVSRIHNLLDDANEYHIIFINPSEKERIGSILRSLKNTGILTIGDMPGFVEQCGIINFYLEGGRVRFEINASVAVRENHKLSSKLLSLARIVISKCD